jgi:hypothetical protein
VFDVSHSNLVASDVVDKRQADIEIRQNTGVAVVVACCVTSRQPSYFRRHEHASLEIRFASAMGLSLTEFLHSDYLHL